MEYIYIALRGGAPGAELALALCASLIASHAALTWAVENLPEATQIHAVRAIPSYVEGLLALDGDDCVEIVGFDVVVPAVVSCFVTK